jgi:hypothetical protein
MVADFSGRWRIDAGGQSVSVKNERIVGMTGVKWANPAGRDDKYCKNL